MAEKTKIEWTDATFNPWIGCQDISPGCDHCYAEAYAKRVGRDFAKRTRTSAAYWKQPLKWNAAAAASGQRRRVFCASLADVFDNDVPRDWRVDLRNLIDATPNIDWLMLTKRIGNFQRAYSGWNLPPNVWLGITVVNQMEADRDIPKLLAIDARVRFLSCEPLLGPIDCTPWLWGRASPCAGCPRDADCACGYKTRENLGEPSLHWVISGGESGPKARPSHPDWFRSLRDQCSAAGIAYLHKQNGEWASVSAVEGSAWHHYFADGATVRRVGKKAAGRMLDGQTHDGFPS